MKDDFKIKYIFLMSYGNSLNSIFICKVEKKINVD